MQKNKPRVSVIIINYNGLNFLPRLLDSLYRQTIESYEIIVVDSGSKDESVEYLRKEHKKLKVTCYPNNGYAFACNRGAEAASGKYLVFLNIDMYLPENFLEKMLQGYENIKKGGVKIGALSCRMVDFGGDPLDAHNTGGTKMDLFGYTYPSHDFDTSSVFSLPGSPFFVDREVFYDIGGFCEFIFFYGEDMDISWRANIYGYKMYVNNDTHLYHFGSASLGSYSTRWSVLIILSEFVPIINCYSLPMLLLVLPVYLLYTLFMVSILYIKLGLKSEIFKEYIQRLSYILSNIKGIWNFRTEVQKKRVISDWKILKYISSIPAFLYKKSWKRVKTK